MLGSFVTPPLTQNNLEQLEHDAVHAPVSSAGFAGAGGKFYVGSSANSTNAVPRGQLRQQPERSRSPVMLTASPCPNCEPSAWPSPRMAAGRHDLPGIPIENLGTADPAGQSPSTWWPRSPRASLWELDRRELHRHQHSPRSPSRRPRANFKTFAQQILTQPPNVVTINGAAVTLPTSPSKYLPGRGGRSQWQDQPAQPAQERLQLIHVVGPPNNVLPPAGVVSAANTASSRPRRAANCRLRRPEYPVVDPASGVRTELARSGLRGDRCFSLLATNRPFPIARLWPRNRGPEHPAGTGRGSVQQAPLTPAPARSYNRSAQRVPCPASGPSLFAHRVDSPHDPPLRQPIGQWRLGRRGVPGRRQAAPGQSPGKSLSAPGAARQDRHRRRPALERDRKPGSPVRAGRLTCTSGARPRSFRGRCRSSSPTSRSSTPYADRARGIPAAELAERRQADGAAARGLAGDEQPAPARPGRVLPDRRRVRPQVHDRAGRHQEPPCLSRGAARARRHAARTWPTGSPTSTPRSTATCS